MFYTDNAYAGNKMRWLISYLSGFVLSIDLKKSIAAAFQANFRGTEEEKESDPQSEHIAHYKYVPHSYCINFIDLLLYNTHERGPRNVKKMHRHIDGDDVID